MEELVDGRGDTETRLELARLRVLRNELEAAVVRASAVLLAARSQRGSKPIDVML